MPDAIATHVASASHIAARSAVSAAESSALSPARFRQRVENMTRKEDDVHQETLLRFQTPTRPSYGLTPDTRRYHSRHGASPERALSSPALDRLAEERLAIEVALQLWPLWV